MPAQEETKRLFLALKVSNELSQNILTVFRKLKKGADEKEINVMWSPPENWHITLIFLGDTPTGRVLKLSDIVKEFVTNQPKFSVELRKLGAFPEVRGARVIWAGVSAQDALVTFQSGLAQALVPWGYVPEERIYAPHLTLGRLRTHKNVTDLLSPWIRNEFGKLLVETVVLYESQQIGHHRRYVPLEQYSLKSG